jgi:uncharacterized metal-binding protein
MNAYRCATCKVRSCLDEPGTKSYPSNCPIPNERQIADEVNHTYVHDREVNALAIAAARTEAEGYPKRPRVEEVMDFARRIGANRLGIAHCIGLCTEASLLLEILEANGFDVYALACKCAVLPKEAIGVRDEEKVRPGHFESLCSPLAQAKIFNKLGTDLNILVGLCVGHDTLFFRYSDAPVTVLVAKDRVTGHNPAAALYLSTSYYIWLKEPRYKK